MNENSLSNYDYIEAVIIADLRIARAYHFDNNEHKAYLARYNAWQTIRWQKARDLEALEEKLKSIWGESTYQQFKLVIKENLK